MYATVGGSLGLWDQYTLLGGDENSVAADDEGRNLTLWLLSNSIVDGDIDRRLHLFCLPRSRQMAH
jgi:hypothetical protein